MSDIAGPSQRILVQPKPVFADAFIHQLILQTFSNDVKGQFFSQDELKELNEAIETLTPNDDFAARCMKKLNILKIDILNKASAISSNDVLEYIRLGVVLAMLPPTEIFERNLAKLEEVVESFEGFHDYPKFYKIKVRNYFCAFIRMSKDPSQYKEAENLLAARKEFERIQCLEENTIEGLLRWMQTPKQTKMIEDMKQASFINLARNVYRYTSETGGSDALVVKFGARYLNAAAADKNNKSLFAIQPHAYLSFVCCCYDVARKSTRIKCLLQSEHYLSTADAILRKAREEKFLENEACIYTVEQHNYVEALIDLGYRHLLASWADNYVKKTESPKRIEGITVDGIDPVQNEPFYKKECTSLSDALDCMIDTFSRELDASKFISFLDPDYLACQETYKAAAVILKPTTIDPDHRGTGDIYKGVRPVFKGEITPVHPPKKS